jgi:hypothetical protein
MVLKGWRAFFKHGGSYHKGRGKQEKKKEKIVNKKRKKKEFDKKKLDRGVRKKELKKFAGGADLICFQF